jgi:ferric-dicitrate binding protein FerR (iron transport regulator)
MNAAGARPAPGRDWKDQLVELHVLAANGDSAAASEAERWLADDPEARKAWAEVEAACDRVRTSEQAGA